MIIVCRRRRCCSTDVSNFVFIFYSIFITVGGKHEKEQRPATRSCTVPWWREDETPCGAPHPARGHKVRAVPLLSPSSGENVNYTPDSARPALTCSCHLAVECTTISWFYFYYDNCSLFNLFVCLFVPPPLGVLEPIEILLSGKTVIE